MKYSVLIIGLGDIGMGYDFNKEDPGFIATHAKSFFLNEDFDLIGGVDIDQKKCNKFKKKYDSFSSISLEETLIKIDPDIIVVSNPTEEHLNTINTIFKFSRPKIILCEKPLSYSIQEGKQIIDLCEKNKANLYVNYMRRVDPGVIEIKKRLSILNHTEDIRGVVWYDKGLIHNGSHFTNLLEFWLGPIKGHKLIKKYENNKYDCLVDINFEFQRGTFTFLSSMNRNFNHYEIQMITNNFCIRYENAGSSIFFQNVQKLNDSAYGNDLTKDKEEIVNSSNTLQYLVTENISNIIRGNNSTLCTGQDALETIDALVRVKKDL